MGWLELGPMAPSAQWASGHFIPGLCSWCLPVPVFDRAELTAGNRGCQLRSISREIRPVQGDWALIPNRQNMKWNYGCATLLQADQIRPSWLHPNRSRVREIQFYLGNPRGECPILGEIGLKWEIKT